MFYVFYRRSRGRPAKKVLPFVPDPSCQSWKPLLGALTGPLACRGLRSFGRAEVKGSIYHGLGDVIPAGIAQSQVTSVLSVVSARCTQSQ